jgi:hypothetical protein
VVKVWFPVDSDEVLKVALPAPFTVPVPRTVEPSRKVTVPVGTPAPGATAPTFAASITGCPKIAGLGDADTVVAVPAWFTTCDKGVDALGAKLLSPPYEAVML